MRRAWTVRGATFSTRASTRSQHGLNMVSTWSQHGLHTQHLSQHGLNMVSTLSQHCPLAWIPRSLKAHGRETARIRMRVDPHHSFAHSQQRCRLSCFLVSPLSTLSPCTLANSKQQHPSRNPPLSSRALDALPNHHPSTPPHPSTPSIHPAYHTSTPPPTRKQPLHPTHHISTPSRNSLLHETRGGRGGG